MRTLDGQPVLVTDDDLAGAVLDNELLHDETVFPVADVLAARFAALQSFRRVARSR